MKARYSLKDHVVGFDFFPWLVMQAQAGATCIVFDDRVIKTDKWPADVAQKRYDSILKPGPALLGLPYENGIDGAELAPFHQSHLVRLYQEGVRFPKLRSVLPARKVPYTITLRRTQRAPGRNSNVRAWRDFAAMIQAQIIDDYEDRPIHLHERMALYAGAKMNFFVTNGPAMLCFLSEYPAMQFGLREDSQQRTLGVAGPLPWLTENQIQVFEQDDLRTILHHFNRWQRSQ